MISGRTVPQTSGTARCNLSLPSVTARCGSQFSICGNCAPQQLLGRNRWPASARKGFYTSARLPSSIAFLTSLLLPPDNEKLFCHHRTHQQTIAQERTQIIRSFRGVSQFYCSPCSAGRSSRSGAPARGTGYVVSFAPSAFALGYRSRGRVSFRAHSDFQLHRDQRSRRLRPAGKFSRESSPGIFSRTVRNLAADCVPRALRLLYLVPGRRKYGGISLDRKLDVHSAALDRRYRICLYRLAYLDDAF